MININDISKNDPEEVLASQLRMILPSFNFVREFRFHPIRKWRFDFALPKEKIAVEVEGGVWTHGRHTRGAGFEGDCEKYNEACFLGWRVLRFSGGMVLDGRAINFLEKLLTS